MARVAQKAACNVVCVLDALEDVGCERELRSLSELSSPVLALEVDVLHPALMTRRCFIGNVLLEDDDIRIRYFDGIRRRENGSSVAVDSFSIESRCG